MNRADVLNITVEFMIADYKYITLINKTLIREGQFRTSMRPGDMERIRRARAERERIEQQMYTAWADSGIE